MKFIKEWGVFILVIALIILSRIFIWGSIQVDGPSMSSTLSNGQQLITSKIGSVNRFDVVVARETLEQTQANNPSATKGLTIVKRVIGLPGDTIAYDDDQLTINGKSYDEPYLKDYLQQYKDGSLMKTYQKMSLPKDQESSRVGYENLITQSRAFTVSNTGETSFTIQVPKGQYLLLGDNRILSADSRKVGTFSRSQIIEKTLFRIWPLNKIGGVD